MIIAGAIVGPFGFHLMERDSSIIMSGTAGLLYIMFLAGLEIDLADFKKNSKKSIVFGLFTFVIPMTLGIFASLYLLNFSLHTSILLASMFASHTLIAYPIISKLGVSKNRAVNITVGGTMITDTLALLVLAIIVGMQKGDVSNEFWINLATYFSFCLYQNHYFSLMEDVFFKSLGRNVLSIFLFCLCFFRSLHCPSSGIEGIIVAFLPYCL
jgi:Kef-type K+ transport system membrane component KefB